jgi:hypothetical protein
MSQVLLFPRKNLLVKLCAVLIVIHSASLVSATAAQNTPLVAEQSLLSRYGHSLSFSIHATASTVLTNAQLTITILNRDKLFNFPVAITPNSQVSISKTVQVAEIELPPAATLTYFWVFEDEAGQQYQSQAVTERYGDNQVPWQWAERRSGQVVVLYDVTDEAITQIVLDTAVRSLDESTRMLGSSISGDIVIYVYPSLASMANSLRKNQTIVQDWVAAYAIPDQQTIFVAADAGPDLLVNLERDLPHELMHVAVFTAANPGSKQIPGWFNEGLALYASGGSDPTLDDVLAGAISDRILLSIETLCTPSFASLPRRDAALAYAQSASIVSYIMRRYGASQISGLMDAYAKGLGCSEGIQLVLGISLQELESQWLKDLSSTASILTQSSNSLLPWLLGWIVSLGLTGLFLFPQPAAETALFDTRVSLPKVPLDATQD